jgi:DNA-binding SARP family transcriptional activator
MGPVEVTGLPGELGDRHKLTEVLVYLATHGERPVPGEALMCACWPDRDIASTTFNQAMSRLRRHLGTAISGERQLPAADGGAYRLGPDVGCDWTSFRALVARAQAAESSIAVTAYREALALVRGEPFAAVGRGTYSWAWSEQLVYEIERAVVQAALALGELGLAQGDHETARWAAVQGRAASPFEPLLFEIQIRAAEQAGDEGELARLREAAGGTRRP